jgi:GTPase SAR1 family protein
MDENSQAPAAPMPAAALSFEQAIAGSPLTRRPKIEPKDEDVSGGSLTLIPKHEPMEDDDRLDQRDNPFANDFEENVELSTRGEPLRTLVKDDVPERLEAAVEVGLRALAEIEKPLRQLAGNADAQSWLAQLENIRQQSQRSRTVVGVVGNTGAGKSSVINALLEEERLVPTNCMRACTAVVTELSYNESTDPAKKYRAEIEFIKPDDWEKELRVLFAEIVDDRGQLSRDVSNQDSEAAVAYSKIRAVYNKHTREMLLKSSVRALMAVGKVKKVLGKIIKINESNPAVFYRRLQNFVDSKEKGTEKLDKNGNKITNPKREFECWPLIKVVRIYVKADALSTGAVIVDLPGVHDSNAARAAVAEGYMKQTSGLWIVAPINRAVDDKAAKNLLGDSFKRQLKFDGTYSAVTFICSKTDDISRTEATDTLKLGDDMEVLEAKFSDITLQKRELERQLKDSKSKKRDFDDAVEEVDDQVDVWEKLLEKAEDGKTVYAPLLGGKKRKSVGASERARKRSRICVDSDMEDTPSRAGDAVGFADEDASDASTQPLSVEMIEEKLGEFKGLKREARREKRAMEDKIRELQESIEELDEECEAIDAKQSALCIAGRNECSRYAIKRDFAAGIRELDEETAAEEDPENFNPDEAIRDYDHVADSLPVFCVSSRAYQKLSNRLKKDSDVAGFTTPDQTEIPQLQAHCKKLTEKGRQAGCRRFLNSVAQLMTSLELWSSDDGNGVKLTSGQRDVEKVSLT